MTFTLQMSQLLSLTICSTTVSLISIDLHCSEIRVMAEIVNDHTSIIITIISIVNICSCYAMFQRLVRAITPGDSVWSVCSQCTVKSTSRLGDLVFLLFVVYWYTMNSVKLFISSIQGKCICIGVIMAWLLRR